MSKTKEMLINSQEFHDNHVDDEYWRELESEKIHRMMEEHRYDTQVIADLMDSAIDRLEELV